MQVTWTDKNGKQHRMEHEFYLPCSLLEEEPVVASPVPRPERVTLTGLILQETARRYGLGKGEILTRGHWAEGSGTPTRTWRPKDERRGV